MARIEDCLLGARVRLLDGWGGDAIVIGQRCNNVVRGCIAAPPHKRTVEQEGVDVVQIRFEQPVLSSPNHRVVAISCAPDELMLSREQLPELIGG